jgi:hypothetical protein
MDSRGLSEIPENSHDSVVMRHFLENQEDWKQTVREAFRIADKRVIIVMRRPFAEQTRLVEQKEDTWVWDIGFGEFNMMARGLSVNVSYGKAGEDELIVIGKHLDDAVFDLDDFHNDNHNLPLLLEMKERFPALKVTLFCIPAKCTVDFIKELKEKYEWMRFAVHGWYHDTDHGTAQETNFWSEQDAHDYLDLAERMGVFEKIFRAPGWNYNYQSYLALIRRGYVICEHLGHDRWAELGGKRYTTGHLWEVHGHIQNVNMNGLEELASTKCNFGPHTRFHFVGEQPDAYLPERYQ